MDGLSSVEIKLWQFNLAAGESRQEFFTSAQESVAISAQLVGTTVGFSYFQGSVVSGTGTGSCTTTIDTLTGDAVSGSFDCDPLPPDVEGTAGQTLSLTFSCPLQPFP
jgi:hypothetical protein